MKKILLLTVAVALLLSTALAFAAGGGEQAAGGKKFRIAVSLPPANNAWQAKMLDSVTGRGGQGHRQVRDRS